MTQVARPETLAGPFDNVRIEEDEKIYRLFRRGDEVWIEASEAPPDAVNGSLAVADTSVTRAPIARRVVMTTGSHHMQVCWAASGAGNLLDELPIVYIRDPRPGKSRWAPLEASYLSPTPPGAESQTHWNTSCLLCHATGGAPGLESTGATNSRVAELGISCEACHGPGERHMRLYRTRAERSAAPLRPSDGAAIVNPARLPAERGAQVAVPDDAVADVHGRRR